MIISPDAVADPLVAAVRSDGGTSPETDTTNGALLILDALQRLPVWTTDPADTGPLRIAARSAADLVLSQDRDGLTFSFRDADLTLDREMRAQTTGTVRFADGSVTVIGDNAAGVAGDDRTSSIIIARDFAAASGKDNLLMGLGGSDRLIAAAGDDRLRGGADHLSLAHLAPEGSGLDLVWVGTAGFSGTAGEVRYRAAGPAVIVQADLDGDGRADFGVAVAGISALAAGDLIL